MALTSTSHILKPYKILGQKTKPFLCLCHKYNAADGGKVLFLLWHRFSVALAHQELLSMKYPGLEWQGNLRWQCLEVVMSAMKVLREYKGGTGSEGEMTAPVGLIKSHIVFWMDLLWSQHFFTKSPCVSSPCSLCGEGRDVMFRSTLGTPSGEAQNRWVRLSGAWKSAKASLGESQRNNNID